MKKIFSGTQLKLICILLMLVDHVHTHFGTVLGDPKWFSLLARFVAPVFLFLLAEGFKYTSSRSKYLKRLLTGAIIMYGINILKNIATHNYIHPYTKQFSIFRLLMGNNIFWTFFLILSLFIIFDKIKNNKAKNNLLLLIPLVILLIVGIILAEGGLYLLPIAIACYYFNNDSQKVCRVIFIWSLILLVKSLLSYFTSGFSYMSLYEQLTFSNEYMMMSAIPFILLYNGKRGGKGQRWEKNLFYIFYPLHLSVIYIFDILLK